MNLVKTALEFWKMSSYYNSLQSQNERDKYIQFVVLPASALNPDEEQRKLFTRLVERHRQMKVA